MADVREGALPGGLPFLAAGRGPSLVVFPALSAEHANPRGLARTRELWPLRPLTRRFTVYLVNRKPGLRPGATIADLAEDYGVAIGATFREPVPILGTSTGGAIAQRLAIEHPELVRRLVLIATACRLSPYAREVQRRLAELIVAGRPRRAWAGYGPAMAATVLGGWTVTALLWLAGRRMTPEDPSDLIAEIQAEDALDVCGELHRITAPTLVIAGGRDRCYPPDLTTVTAKAIPDARLRLYPRRGHFGTVAYRPAIREILDFLTADAARP